MIKWADVIHFTNKENPTPDKKVEKTEEEWKQSMTPEEFQVTRLKGTERSFSSVLSVFMLYNCQGSVKLETAFQSPTLMARFPSCSQ